MNEVKNFLVALQFLTILPVKIKAEIREENFGSSLFWFPFVGLLVGLVLSLIAVAFNFLPPLVISALVLIAAIVITGGIHLDGLGDTCDGFYGTKSKEEILAIMRDSRSGVMGIIGVVCLLLLKFSLIANIPPPIFCQSLIMMAVFARWSQVLACFTSDYARLEGKAKYFLAYKSRSAFLGAGFFTLLLFLLLMKLKGVILLILSLLFILLFIGYIKRRIGGMTGDTIGATSELAEVVFLFSLLIYLKAPCCY